MDAKPLKYVEDAADMMIQLLDRVAILTPLRTAFVLVTDTERGVQHCVG